jgi:hypothetical protein
MARPLRIEFAGALYHLTSRGNERCVIDTSASIPALIQGAHGLDG